MPSINPIGAVLPRVGTARAAMFLRSARANLAGGVFGKAFDAGDVLPLRDQPRGEVVEFGGLTAIRLHGTRTAIRVAVSAPIPFGVKIKIKLFGRLSHALKSRREEFRHVRNSFGEIRNV